MQPDRAPLSSKLLGAGLRAYLSSCAATSRTELEDLAQAEISASGTNGIILTFWHEASALMPMAWQAVKPLLEGRPAALILSRSRDTEMIRPLVARLGITAIIGSSEKRPQLMQKGGLSAMLQARDHLLAGGVLGVALDGPRGPAKIAQPGVPHLAARTGAACIHMEFAASPRLRAGSWDRMLIPVPFGRIKASVGNVTDAPRDQQASDCQMVGS